MMKKILYTLGIIVVVVGVAYVVYSEQVAQQWANVGASATGGAATTPGNQGALRSTQFDYRQLLRVIEAMDADERAQILADSQLFTQLVERELRRVSFIDAANASPFARDESNKYLLARQSDDLLINSYINHQLLNAGVPEGFPDDQQVQQFYRQNKSNYWADERLPVWQIFWPIAEDASPQDATQSFKAANLLRGKIKQGKISFEQAAWQHSEHVKSRLQGGYMGMLLTSDLRPEVKEKLLDLAEGAVSEPIRGAEGLHLFRRGPIQPPGVLPLEKVRDIVVRDMLQQLRKQQRDELNRLVLARYPVNLESGQLQDWQQRAATHFGQSADGQ